MWDNLTMAQKNELMKTYIKAGIKDLPSIINHYNSFSDGGTKKTYQEWVSAMTSKYPWLEMNSANAGYDYERYFNENYQDAISRLTDSEPRHFTDKYKLPGHPTFSDESVYSQGPMIGGHWTVGDTFVPSTNNAQRYPWLYNQNRQYSEAEIDTRRAGGLYDTSKDNFADLTPIDLSIMKANRKMYGKDRYIDNKLMQDLDNYLVYRGVGLPQRQAILFSVQQEGSTAESHGNGAYGLVGWRGNRLKEVLGKNARQQATYLVNTLYEKDRKNISTNWHNGGEGSGYQNAREAQDAFINAKTAKDATHALNFGYIRPDYSDRIFREDNVNGMFGIE